MSISLSEEESPETLFVHLNPLQLYRYTAAESLPLPAA